MIYSNLLLFSLGLLGVVLHNLVKINEINKDPNKGTFRFNTYLKTEWASIAISAIVVFVAVLVKNEIKQLSIAANWLGVGFVAVGYMAQSLLISFMGKAQKTLNDKIGN